MTTLPDSGSRREFGTGSVRDNACGKGRMDLLPPWALIRLSQHFEAGADKYDARNWEQGQPLGAAYLSSGLRHICKYLICRQTNEDDEDHLAAACWNFMCLMDTEERIMAGVLPASLDDLPQLHFGEHAPDASTAKSNIGKETT